MQNHITPYSECDMYTGRAKKVTPGKNFYISEIVADIFTKFAEFTDEDSVHISCKFY